MSTWTDVGVPPQHDIEQIRQPVSVVVATRDRPALLDRAIRALLAQDYPGEIEVLVVFDQSEPRDLGFDVAPGRTVRALPNVRRPGLAGGRNSGILAAGGDLIAFCDDDDEWLPDKLSAQVELFEAHPGAALAATGITIRTESGDHERVGPTTVGMDTYIRARMPEIHPSTFLLRRADLLGDLGMIDEEIPSSYGEDYDLLLRASRLGYTVNVERPLVNIYWNRPSYFAEQWSGIADGLTYILGKTPELRSTRVGRARVEGQIAFAHAAAGQRREAARWAKTCLAHDPTQLRAYAALVVGAKVVTPRRVVGMVQAQGRGL